MRREMGQLVKAYQCDLRALPVEDRGVELQVRELDLAGTRPTPFVGSVVWDTAEPGIKVHALIPQPAGIGDLGCRAAKEHRGKARYPADIAQRLEDQSDGLPATCGTAIDADVGRRAKKLGLRSGLRYDCGFLAMTPFHIPFIEAERRVRRNLRARLARRRTLAGWRFAVYARYPE
jgi:hypothetical protein